MFKKTKVLSVLILLCYGTMIYAGPENYTKKNQQLKKTLIAVINEDNIPGVVISYGFKNQPLQTVCAGFSDIKSKTLMNDNTVFIIGSITKSFIAASILQLVEAKKITVNDSLSKIASQYGGELAKDLAKYPTLGPVTIKQLLNHTSGVPEDVNTPEFVASFIKNPTLIWSDQDLLAIAMKRPFYFRPGEVGAWSYTNTDYLLLSIVLKSITKQSISKLFSQLWSQAGLKNIYYADNGIIPDAALKNLAAGYMPINDKDRITLAFKDFPKVILPGKLPLNAYTLKTGYNVFDPTSSGIITTTQSLALWYRTLFYKNFLKPGSIRVMLNGVPIAQENNLKYGFGVVTAVMPTYGYLVTHNGLGPGYSVAVFYFFKYDLVVSIATNSSNSSVNTFDIFSGKLLPGILTKIMPLLIVKKSDDNASLK